MTPCCSNDSISRTKSVTLVNACDLEQCAAWSVLPSIWKQRYYFMGGGSFWPGLWVLFLCRHQQNLGTLCSDTLIVVFRSFKEMCIVITQKTRHLSKWHCDILLWGSQSTEHHHNPTKYGPLLQVHSNCFSGSFKRLSIVFNRNIWDQYASWEWVGCRLVFMDDRRISV